MKLDLIRVTEAAAIAAAKFVGSGEKKLADKAATEAMKDRLDRLDMAATVRIGEGKKDDSYGLFKGDRVGHGWYFCGESVFLWDSDTQEYDLAVDPIDGTTPTVTSGPEAMSVLAMAGPGTMFQTEEFYMHKLAYGPRIAQKVKLHIEDDFGFTLRTAAVALGKDLSNLMVCILNRPRHAKFIELMRVMGVRIKLIQDCDISGAIAACRAESGVDLLWGIGGAPESVLTAAAIKCLHGDFQAQIADGEGNICDSRPMTCEDLVRGPCIFAATGITNGSLLHGVRWNGNGAVTNSIFMRSESGTVRYITTEHGN